MDVFNFSTSEPVSIFAVQRVFETLAETRVSIPLHDQMDGPYPILVSPCLDIVSQDFNFTPAAQDIDPLTCLKLLAQQLGVSVVTDLEWQGQWLYVQASPEGALFDVPQADDGELDYAHKCALIPAAQAA